MTVKVPVTQISGKKKPVLRIRYLQIRIIKPDVRFVKCLFRLLIVIVIALRKIPFLFASTTYAIKSM